MDIRKMKNPVARPQGVKFEIRKYTDIRYFFYVKKQVFYIGVDTEYFYWFKYLKAKSILKINLL